MSEFSEGAFFRQEDIVKSPEEVSDFIALRNFDYVHVIDGYCTRIIETQYLRRLPKVDAVLEAYAALRKCNLTETGDRTAWRMRIKQWEPLQGYRYYSDGCDDLLTLGHMKIRLLASPAWARDQSPEAVLFRCFYDQPLKELTSALTLASAASNISLEDVVAAARFGASIEDANVPEEWVAPRITASAIMVFLKRREDT